MDDLKLIRQSDTHWLIMCPYCLEVHALSKNNWNVNNPETNTPTIIPSIQTEKCHFTVFKGVCNNGKISIRLEKF